MSSLKWSAGLGVAVLLNCSLDERQVNVAQLAAGPDAGDRQVASSAGESADVGQQVVEPAATGGAGFEQECEGLACECEPGGCKLIAGELCTGADVCATANCRATNSGDNVCCAADCSPGESCTAEGTGCEPVATCNANDKRCSGSIYQQCSEGIWEDVVDCQGLGCDRERNGCLLAAGDSCVRDADCGEGTCAATADPDTKVCCSATCSASCQACLPSGVECEDLDGDESCGVPPCPPDTFCRSYFPNSEGQRCSSGSCLSPEQLCSFSAQNVNRECDANNLCDDQGNCSRPKLSVGSPCSLESECFSGACEATAGGGSACCSSQCSAIEICSASGGCELAPVCSNGTTRCSGSSFQRCNAGQWSTEIECGVQGCNEEFQGCFSGLGDSCSGDGDCGVGRCQPSPTGRVCCTAPCDGACRECAPAGQSCVNLADDSACGFIDCPADSICADFPNGVTSQRCVGGRCGSSGELCQAVPQAVGQACSSTSLCDAAGSCSQPKRSLGEQCDNNAECSSNFCVDGLCCNEGCSANCETCSAGGLCRGTADDLRCAPVFCSALNQQCVTSSSDITTNRCERKGVCKTDSACGFVPSRTECATGSINGLCDGSGQCRPPTVACGGGCGTFGVGNGSTCCALFSDSATICVGEDECGSPPNTPISCDEHSDCASGNVCCLAGNSVLSFISCRTPGQCSSAPNPQGIFQQVCNSPGGGSAACPNGQSCVPADTSGRLGGWSFCKVAN